MLNVESLILDTHRRIVPKWGNHLVCQTFAKQTVNVSPSGSDFLGFVSLCTLNHGHCQIEILIFSTRSPLVLPLASLHDQQNIHPGLGTILPVYLGFHSLPCSPMGSFDLVHIVKDVATYRVWNPWFHSSLPPLSSMLPDPLSEFSHLGIFFSLYRSTWYHTGGLTWRVKGSLLIENCPLVTLTLNPLFFYSAFFMLTRFHSMIHSRSRFSLSFWSL